MSLQNIPVELKALTFTERAELVTQYGIPVVPLKPRSKDPFLNNWPNLATVDSDQIDEWAKKYPAHNCASVGRVGEFWIFEVDAAVLYEQIKKETGHSCDEFDTLSVRSSGEKRHFYFKHDAQSELMGNFSVDNKDGEMFSVRGNNAYVVAPGSIHPKTGLPYEIMTKPVFGEIPIAPDWLMDWLKIAKRSSTSQKTRIASDNEAKIPEGERDEFLFAEACKLRDTKLSQKAALAALLVVNSDRCVPPMAESDVKIKITSAYKRDARVKSTKESAGSSASQDDAMANAATPKGVVRGFTTAPVSGTGDQITLKKVVWLWPSRFAQKLNLIVGNPDQGKGLITQYVAACVTRGRNWFDGRNLISPSDVLIMSNEDDWEDTIAPRLVAAGADMTKIHWLKMADTLNGKKSEERDLQLDRDADALETFLTEHPEIRLVIVDPVSNYLGNVKMIDEQSVRAKILMPLKGIASRRKIAVIAVMHMNKKIELDAIHRAGGALAFVGVARMAWLVAPKPPAEDGTKSKEMLMVKIKGNIVSQDLKGLSFKVAVTPVPIENDQVMTPCVEWLGDVDTNANDLTGRAREKNPAHRKAEQMPAARRWLLEYLKDGAKTVDDIEDEGLALHGFSPKTLQRARDEAGIVPFKNGETYKARDGKMRPVYAWRLSDNLMAEQHEPGV